MTQCAVLVDLVVAFASCDTRTATEVSRAAHLSEARWIGARSQSLSGHLRHHHLAEVTPTSAVEYVVHDVLNPTDP